MTALSGLIYCPKTIVTVSCFSKNSQIFQILLLAECGTATTACCVCRCPETKLELPRLLHEIQKICTIWHTFSFLKNILFLKELRKTFNGTVICTIYYIFLRFANVVLIPPCVGEQWPLQPFLILCVVTQSIFYISQISVYVFNGNTELYGVA
jgi:hypothetical protein